MPSLSFVNLSLTPLSFLHNFRHYATKETSLRPFHPPLLLFQRTLRPPATLSSSSSSRLRFSFLLLDFFFFLCLSFPPSSSASRFLCFVSSFLLLLPMFSLLPGVGKGDVNVRKMMADLPAAAAAVAVASVCPRACRSLLCLCISRGKVRLESDSIEWHHAG